MPKRLSKVLVNLENYRHNIQTIKSTVGKNVAVMAVVKANAYGHGIEKIAQAALNAGAEYIGVVSVGELERVRSVGITAPCLILNYLDASSIDEAIELDGSITAMDAEFIKELQERAEALNKSVKVHLKIDSGMHRAGCEPKDAPELAVLIASMPYLHLEGIFTHFAESEDATSDYTNKQLSVFKKCINEIKAQGVNPGLVHCANSAAIFAHPSAHFDMVRPGILSYGINPFAVGHPHHAFVSTHFRDVLEIRSQIAYIRKLKIGGTVGYNRRWKAKRPSIVALVPIGYGDGFRRTPHNAGHMLVAGNLCPIVGSVSMDQTVIDITDVPGARVSDEVVILGKQGTAEITVDDIAQAYQTINYEVVTALSDRLERIYFKKIQN